MDKAWHYGNCHLTEVGKAWADKSGTGSWIITECGNRWYSGCSDPMRRNGCLCPKCGKTIVVDARLFNALKDVVKKSED